MELFGFEIKRRFDKGEENTKSETIKSFVPPVSDDGVATVTTGGYFGQYYDIDGTGGSTSDKDMIFRYRSAAEQPETDNAIDDIVNEAITSSDIGMPVSINLDDPYGIELYNKIKTKNFKFVNFGFNEKCELKLTQLKKIEKIWQLEILYKNKLYKTEIGLVGHFQIYNALAAASICLGLGLKQDSIFKSLSYLQTVPGRMQIINHPLCKATIIVDYAHTPDALENAILGIKKMNISGKIYTLFGCGGERDQDKRSKMGEVAFKNSDFTIITDDNPRTEDPSLIRKSIINNNSEAIEIPGRDGAIKKAISFLNDDDVLIIAGKGHEQTQTIGIETLPFNDVSVVKNTLDNLNP